MTARQEFTAQRGSELPAALVEICARMRRNHAAALDIINEMANRQTEMVAGYPSLATYLSDLLRITTRKATGLIAQAESGPSR